MKKWLLAVSPSCHPSLSAAFSRPGSRCLQAGLKSLVRHPRSHPAAFSDSLRFSDPHRSGTYSGFSSGPGFRAALWRLAFGKLCLLHRFPLRLSHGGQGAGGSHAKRRMDPEEASYLLGFINNVSPSFVITFLVTESLERPDLLLPTRFFSTDWPFLYGLFTRPGLFHRKTPAFSGIKNASVVQIRFELLDACIYDAVNTLLKLGGYVVLFSVLAEMTACLPFLPEKTAALLGGMLEITSGFPAS